MWEVRPSDLLYIEDPYHSYCLNQAVGHFGTIIEGEMDEAESQIRRRKGKTNERAIQRARLQVLERYGISSAKKRQFADPAAMM